MEAEMDKSASPRPEFVVAQPLTPRAALFAWLGHQPATALLRVPVELDVSVLGVRGAALGFADDRPQVKINDSALGESLADHAQMWCAGQSSCAMWLWAHWTPDGLRVVKAEAPIAAADRAAATHLFVAR
jgi:hypothetical protein